MTLPLSFAVPPVVIAPLSAAQTNVSPADATKLPSSIFKWLARFQLNEYAESFQKAGYDTEDFLIGISEDVSEIAGSACRLVVFTVSLTPNVRGKADEPTLWVHSPAG